MGPALLLALLVAAQPAATQTLPPSDAALPPTVSHPNIVVHVYAEPSFNWMAAWHARIDALKVDAVARAVPISNEFRNGFVAWGATFLVRLTPRVLVGGELGEVRDQDGFTVTEPYGGALFPGSADFGVGVETIGRNGQFVVAFYPGEQSRTHVQVGAGMGQSHVMFSTRRTMADGEGAGPILSALVGTEWKMFYLTAGARVHRIQIRYTSFDDPGIRSGQGLPHGPNVDLSGVFVRVGLAFRWLRD